MFSLQAHDFIKEIWSSEAVDKLLQNVLCKKSYVTVMTYILYTVETLDIRKHYSSQKQSPQQLNWYRIKKGTEYDRQWQLIMMKERLGEQFITYGIYYNQTMQREITVGVP